MKNFKKTIFACLLVTIIFTITSCDKTESTPSQNFLESFLADSLYKKPSINSSGTSFFDFGLNFQTNKPGKITKVGVRCPNAGTYKATLWDATTKTIIFTKSIEQEQATTKKWVSVDPLVLEANKKYTFTLLSNNWYQYATKAAITFPYTKNNIVFLGYSWISTTTGVNKFPLNNDNSYYAGDVDFTFQPN